MLMRAVHPGEILKDELDITPTEFARQIDVPPNRISQIIAGKGAITGDTALRFGHWFGTEPQFCSTCKALMKSASRRKRPGMRLRGCRCGQAWRDPTRRTSRRTESEYSARHSKLST